MHLVAVDLYVLEDEVLYVFGMDFRLARGGYVDIFECEVLEAVLVDGALYVEYDVAVNLDIAQGHV